MHTTLRHIEHHKMRAPCRKSLILAVSQLQTCLEETQILDLDRCRELCSLNLKTNRTTTKHTNKQTPPLRTSNLFLKFTGKFFRTLNNRFSLYPAFCCIPRGKDFYSTPDLQHNLKWSQTLLSLERAKRLSPVLSSDFPVPPSFAFRSHLRMAPVCCCHRRTRWLWLRLGSVNQNTTLTSPSPMNNNLELLNWF